MPQKRSYIRRSFRENFTELESYIKEHKTTSIPNGFTTDTGLALASWVTNTKASWKAGKLSADKIIELEKLGYQPPNQKGVAGSIKAIRKFLKIHGHVKPGPDVIVDGYRLQSSIYNIRRKYVDGSLSLSEIQKLLELGIILDRQRQGIDALKEFVREFGHANVPRSFNGGKFPLRSWLNQMRAKWRRGLLSDSEVQELQNLGVTPEIRRDFFEEGILVLEAIRKRTGSAYVSERHVENGMNIGAWVRDRRKEWRKGQLAQDRIERLTALGYAASNRKEAA